MIELLLADDQKIVREGLKKILSLAEEISVKCEANSGIEALELLKDNKVDIALLDVRMPEMDGIETAHKIKIKYPSVKTIILTTFNEDAYLFTGIKEGIYGYILKDSDIDEIIRCIRKVYNGEYYFDSGVMPKIVEVVNQEKKNEKNKIVDNGNLTQREKEIIEYIISGKSNLEIAEALFISKGTVKNAVSKILCKLNLKRRTQLFKLFR